MNLKWAGVNLVGVQVCLWSEVNNGDTQLPKLLTRAAAASERGWNTNLFKGQSTDFRDIAGRLAGQVGRLAGRGLAAAPVSN
jgi:N-acetyl-beta-hexosaminidase